MNTADLHFRRLVGLVQTAFSRLGDALSKCAASGNDAGDRRGNFKRLSSPVLSRPRVLFMRKAIEARGGR